MLINTITLKLIKIIFSNKKTNKQITTLHLKIKDV
jgi:hypothetical protein